MHEHQSTKEVYLIPSPSTTRNELISSVLHSANASCCLRNTLTHCCTALTLTPYTIQVVHIVRFKMIYKRMGMII